MEYVGLHHKSDSVKCRQMSWANKEMLDVMWCVAADVRLASLILDPTLIGAQESAVSQSNLEKGHTFWLSM